MASWRWLCLPSRLTLIVSPNPPSRDLLNEVEMPVTPDLRSITSDLRPVSPDPTLICLPHLLWPILLTAPPLRMHPLCLCWLYLRCLRPKCPHGSTRLYCFHPCSLTLPRASTVPLGSQVPPFILLHTLPQFDRPPLLHVPPVEHMPQSSAVVLRALLAFENFVLQALLSFENFMRNSFESFVTLPTEVAVN
ncbi:hypothetical protein M0R45_035544 [Rubus argutus]|uniref:Uncharacterized protein n=1 Tax=Rubus argutus TaxID=59490 RepID=A0AAW1VXP2_RUBAR